MIGRCVLPGGLLFQTSESGISSFGAYPRSIGLFTSIILLFFGPKPCRNLLIWVSIWRWIKLMIIVVEVLIGCIDWIICLIATIWVKSMRFVNLVFWIIHAVFKFSFAGCYLGILNVQIQRNRTVGSLWSAVWKLDPSCIGVSKWDFLLLKFHGACNTEESQ